ncbi:MAG: FAD-binding dehydrogenase [Dehalococcoidia bacterium]|nr:FAD-binding dehydrogenase [Dehalococcoidia bacterium]|tara:strand:+ start:11032 stop:12678 length:1647 start_codon:yes stop_codon:yes gene_type:complete
MALPERWDLEVDVAVLGSGASATTAAILASDSGAEVALLERAEVVGGTTALSGGVLWIPNNHHMLEAGIEDSREDALAYLSSLSLGMMDDELVETLVDTGPEMLRYMEENTPVSVHVFEGYPDYHPENPGGKPGGGRSLDNDLFPFEELGPWSRLINHQPDATFLPATMLEIDTIGLDGIPSEVLEARRAKDMRSTGQALAGSLIKGCLDREIPVQTSTRARQLILDETDTVVGVRAERNGQAYFVKARKAVVIASGGFEWNRELVKAFLRGPMTAPTSTPENEGDGLLMAMGAGAALGNMSEAWWIPGIHVPGDNMRGRDFARLILAERTWPRSIIVNRKGKRFMNEAANYNAVGHAFHTFDPNTFEFINLPAWLVVDSQYEAPIARYRVGPEAPSWIRRGGSLPDLANEIGVDAVGLEETVLRFNRDAIRGEDPEFQRGVSAYDSYNGDHRVEAPFTTLGPIDTPPYYAVQIESGVLGTKGGPQTNEKAQVMRATGGVIPGLYAVGNAMAGVTAMVYGGAGGTLGPGMTFGYIAGMNAAQEPNHIS